MEMQTLLKIAKIQNKQRQRNELQEWGKIQALSNMIATAGTKSAKKAMSQISNKIKLLSSQIGDRQIKKVEMSEKSKAMMNEQIKRKLSKYVDRKV